MTLRPSSLATVNTFDTWTFERVPGCCFDMRTRLPAAKLHDDM